MSIDMRIIGREKVQGAQGSADGDASRGMRGVAAVMTDRVRACGKDLTDLGSNLAFTTGYV